VPYEFLSLGDTRFGRALLALTFPGQIQGPINVRRPMCVRLLSDAQREAMEDCVGSSDTCVLPRCRALLANPKKETAYRLAHSL
jgi:hypothetical protein